MPWFPDFVSAAELARKDTAAAGQADPVAQYLMALTKGDAYALEATWPGHIVVLDPYTGEVHGHRHLRHFVRTSHAFLAERLVDVGWVASTSVGGRAVVELLAHLKLEGEPVTWPVAVVAESTDDQSVTFRTSAANGPSSDTAPSGRRSWMRIHPPSRATWSCATSPRSTPATATESCRHSPRTDTSRNPSDRTRSIAAPRSSPSTSPGASAPAAASASTAAA